MDLLVIEDEAVLGKALQRGLSDSHHECTWVRNGKKGLDLGLSQRFDAIILDLLLPDMEGLQVLDSLRTRGVQTPVLVLISAGSVENMGAASNRAPMTTSLSRSLFPQPLIRFGGFVPPVE